MMIIGKVMVHAAQHKNLMQPGAPDALLIIVM